MFFEYADDIEEIEKRWQEYDAYGEEAIALFYKSPNFNN